MTASRTVLLVDDDAAFVDAATLLLEDQGHRVIKACSGQEAIRQACEQAIDVAVIDVHLPDVGGVDVAQAIGQGNTSPAVIMISGDDSQATVVGCMGVHARAFLPKPLVPSEFLRLVSEAQGASVPRDGKHV